MTQTQTTSNNVELLGTYLNKDTNLSSRWDYEHKLRNNVSKENFEIFLKAFEPYLKKHKIKYINVEFSGGHDEGGIDDITYLNASNKEIKNLPTKKFKLEVFEFSSDLDEPNWDTRKKYCYYKKRITKEVSLPTFFENLVYDTGCMEEYGSFAGDYHVSGTIKIDLLGRTWSLDGSETVESYQDVSNEGGF